MAFLGSIAGAVTGGLFGLAGSAMSSSSAKKAAERQIAAERENYQNRYQWQVADMRKAGLNPALSYTTGAGSAPSASMASVPDFGSNMAKGASVGIQTALAQAQVNNIESQTALNSAKAQETELSIPENRKRFKLEVEKAKEEISLLSTRNMQVLEKLPYEIQNLVAQTENALSSAQYGSLYRVLGNIFEKVTDFVDTTVPKGDVGSFLGNFLKKLSGVLVAVQPSYQFGSFLTNSAKTHFGIGGNKPLTQHYFRK